MRGLKPFLLAVSLAFVSGAANAEAPSFGIGVGIPYSGFGFNAMWGSERTLGHLSLGCAAFSVKSNGDDRSTCGAGVGVIQISPFSLTSNRHGIGLYLGPMGVDRPDGGEDDFGKLRYGTALSYYYFLNGASNPGLLLGAGYGGTFEADRRGVFLSLGYQF